jgi:hypothetical protein
MPEVIPFITLGITAGSAAVGAVQTADAQGEAKKQADASAATEQKVLSEQQQQETQLEQGAENDARRNAQLSALKQKEGEGFAATYNGGSGMSMFGMPGFAANTKPGASLFAL